MMLRMHDSMTLPLILSVMTFSSLAGCGGSAPRPLPAPEAPSGCLVPMVTSTQQQALKGLNLGALKPGHGNAPDTVEGLLLWRGQPTEAHWAALPEEAGATLMAVAGDPEREVTIRARAFAGLAARSHPAGEQPMLVVLGTPGADETLRRSAIRSLAASYLAGALKRGAETPVVTALLKALEGKQPLEREATVKALAPYQDDPVIKGALEAQAKSEQDPMVKQALKAALER
ncbi:MAG: hypothetical protein ACE366_05645 [Bradymonadia bacterium]